MPGTHHGTPRLCVAADFGTTYTGVAWLNRNDEPPQTWIVNDWPGAFAAGNTGGDGKVPSVLSKKPSPNGSHEWGFLCGSETPETEKWRYLKMFLEPRLLENSQKRGMTWAPKSMAEVHTLVGAYLAEVYKHIRQNILTNIGKRDIPWEEIPIEFIFSVPTTWQGQAILNDFLRIIRGAGFGESAKHEVILGLTEAEAAAICSLHELGARLPFENGDVFLSIDAGGGTTDLGFVKVRSARPPAMEQIQAVRGIGVGSMMIDLGFQQLVEERLDKHPDPDALFELPPNLPVKLSQSPFFMAKKHEFGDPAFSWEKCRIEILGVRHNFSCQELGIEKAYLVVQRSELERLFNDQLTEIVKLLGEALENFEKDDTHDAVRCIILSGGLGSSHYILQRLEEHVQRSLRPSLRRTQVRMCREPQLVVVKGLLLEHTKSILRTRIARASYGVVVRERYSAKRHFNPPLEVDECDDEVYATEQIKWIIKRGQKLVHGEPLFATITRHIRAEGNAPLTWRESIVWSDNPERCEPRAMSSPGVGKLYEVKVDMSEVPAHQLVTKKKKSKSFFWKTKFTYHVCEYELHLNVGPSGDLRFSILYKGEPLPGSSAPEKVMLRSTWDTSAVEEAKR